MLLSYQLLKSPNSLSLRKDNDNVKLHFFSGILMHFSDFDALQSFIC